MKIRTLVGYLLGLVAVVLVSWLSLHNRELLEAPFRVGQRITIPLYLVGILVFLAGFLPPGIILAINNVRRDLAERQERRSSRQSVSLDQLLRRAVDFQADSQLGKAVEQLELFLQERPDDFVALLRYGQVLRQLDRGREALEVHRQASEKYPGSVGLLYELVEDYEQTRQPEVASEIRNRIVRDFPGYGVQVRRHHRSQAIARRDWKTATEDQDEIDAMLAGGPDENASHRDATLRRGLVYQRGVALLEVDRAKDSAEIFRGLLSDEPRFIPGRIMLGECYLMLEDEASAVAEWRRGFDTTGSPVFLQRIEDYFIDLEEPMRAIETLRGIIAESKTDVLPRFFLGRLYYRLEMHDEAEKNLVRLGERIDSSPTYHYLLGRIHERRGEMGRAAESFLACAKLLGVRNIIYRCRQCREDYEEWCARCDNCGAWNSVELGFEQERLDPSELGIEEVPIWGGNGGFV